MSRGGGGVWEMGGNDIIHTYIIPACLIDGEESMWGGGGLEMLKMLTVDGWMDGWMDLPDHEVAFSFFVTD